MACHHMSYKFLQCFEGLHVTIFAEIDFFRLSLDRTRPWSWIMRRGQPIPHLPQALQTNPSLKHYSARGGLW